MKKYIRIVLVLTMLIVLGIVQANAQVNPETMFPADEDVLASAAIVNTEGEMIGGVIIATFEEEYMTGQLGVWVVIWAGLEPGYHAFHIHSVGTCDIDEGFTTSRGHFNPDGTTHGSHAGDLPSLYATADGGAALIFLTDAFTVEDLLDEDGSAFMIHAGRDNYGNIPERYGEADEATLGAGDAGSRIACGVIEMGMSSEFDD